MSADLRRTALESLQCHFTWDLNRTRSVLLLLRDKLEDVGSEEGNQWLGHIYNLQGFIQYQLGRRDAAQSLFTEAAEAFHRVRHADHGPWLVVNYGDLAWLHHHLGDQEQSQVYLSKVHALMEEYPSPSHGELHPEVCAEKAWTLMFLRGDLELVADLFQRAAGMQPDMVEWKTSHVLSLVKAQERRETGVTLDLFERMRQAKEEDPENLYLAVLYLQQRAKRGERIDDEAHEITKHVFDIPGGSYNCIRTLLKVYKYHLSIDTYIDLAEEALKKHPDQHYLKTFLAHAYKHKLLSLKGRRPSPDMINRGISLQEDVVSLYPHTPLMRRIDLAVFYAYSGPNQARAELIFKELLDADLEPSERQLLYNSYARYLNYERNDLRRSIHFHMKAIEIPEDGYFREHSVMFLEKIRDKGKMQKEINTFLKKYKSAALKKK